jgi:hypothetical protein
MTSQSPQPGKHTTPHKKPAPLKSPTEKKGPPRTEPADKPGVDPRRDTPPQ